MQISISRCLGLVGYDNNKKNTKKKKRNLCNNFFKFSPDKLTVQYFWKLLLFVLLKMLSLYFIRLFLIILLVHKLNGKLLFLL